MHLALAYALEGSAPRLGRQGPRQGPVLLLTTRVGPRLGQVRVWNAGSGECAQSIMHPSTVWGCAVLPNGDLVAGCADGNAYVWTRAAVRVAAPDLAMAFKEAVAGTSLPAQQAKAVQT